MSAASTRDRDFAELVRTHHRMVRGRIAMMVFDPDCVDDLAQEVFLRACERMDRVEPAAFASWLRGIARHVVQEHIRAVYKGRRSIAIDETCLASDETDATATSGAPDDVATLRMCLDALSGRSRRMITWRYQEELPAEEIGSKIGMQPGAVRVALLRIREQLKACLERRHGSAASTGDAT